MFDVTLEFKKESPFQNEIHLPFPSEESYNSAMDWYNSQSKKQILNYCERQGISLDSRKKDTLIEHWADVAMSVYAWCQYPVTTQFGEKNAKYMPMIQHIKKLQIELYEVSEGDK